MVIEYQNSIDDYREMTDAIAAARRPVNGPMQIVVLVVVFGIYYAVTRFLWQKAGDTDGHMAWVNMWIAIVAFGATWLAMTIPASIRSRRFPWLTGRQWISLGTFAFLIASLVFQDWMNRHYGPRGRSATLTWQTLLPHSIWLMLLIYVSAVAAHNHRTSLPRHWQNRPDLQRLQSVEITATGLNFTDNVSRREYQWQAFARGEETRNLFLLFHCESVALMLPKRTLDSKEQLNAMRNLMKLIPASSNRGFPVTMVQPGEGESVIPTAHAA